ncbi:hypothetical protein HK104_002931 [Borealophlyctis nickersoniae]|nr:hypothetical protein HK104_002931 [Borealophlyctis nickersoniae]
MTVNQVVSLRDAFLGAETVKEHATALDQFGAQAYFDEICTMVDKKITITPATKARVLAALWSKQERAIFDRLVFEVRGFFSASEAFKLVPLIDGPRQARQLKKKLEKRGEAMRKTKKTVLETQIQDLERDMHDGNLTQSFAKRMRRWAATLSEETLEFYALNFPTAHWKTLADLCHLRPTDFKTPWFLPYVFGEPAPPTSSVHIYTTLTTESLPTALDTHPHLAKSYSTIRQRIQQNQLTLTDAAKVMLTQLAPLEDVLWFYEEIVQGCSAADKVLEGRLRQKEPIGTERERINYPKLMERILLLKGVSPAADLLLPYGEELLSAIQFPENNLRIAVFGDSSPSMQVAIKTATIIGSLLAARLDAELTFFDHARHFPTIQPRTAADVLTVTDSVQIHHSTSPAVCLYPYYATRTPMDLFIVVTDEEENTACPDSRMMFAPMFMKYKEEVNPDIQLFFVSFLEIGDQGYMVSQLKQAGLEQSPRQFRLDTYRPDLSKFDELVGLLNLQILDMKGRNAVEEVREGVEAMTVADGEGAGATEAQELQSEVSEGTEGWVEV